MHVRVCDSILDREKEREVRGRTHIKISWKNKATILYITLFFFSYFIFQLATYNASGTAYEVTVSLTLYMLSARLLLFMER